MGIFRRDRRTQIGPEQEQRAAASLMEWERAGSVTEWSRAANALAAQGGWDWWLQLATKASAERNVKLVGQIDCFVTQSKGILGNRSGFPTLTAAVHRAFDEVTVEALRNAQPDLMIQDGSAGAIDVETLLGWATLRLRDGMY